MHIIKGESVCLRGVLLPPGAELANVLNEAALEAVRRRADLVARADIYNGMDRILQVSARLPDQAAVPRVCSAPVLGGDRLHPGPLVALSVSGLSAAASPKQATAHIPNRQFIQECCTADWAFLRPQAHV